MPFIPYEAPFWFGTGSQVAGTTTVSPAWPTHEEGDVGILIVNTGGYPSSAGITANGTGWVEVPASPLAMTGTFAATNPHVLTVFLCRAAGSTMPAPEVTNGGGDYITAQIGVIRGCRRADSVLDALQAWAVAAHSGTTTAGSIAFPAVTTTVGRSLIVLVASTGDDNSAVQASTITNSNLYFPTEQIDNGTSTGGGGETYVAQGRWMSAGDVGSTTVAVSPGSRQFARMTLAFIPPQEEDAPVDETAPTITVVSPAPEDGVGPLTPIAVDFTDETGLSAHVVIADILDPDTGEVLYEDVVHDGDDFGIHYQNSANTFTAISGGYRLNVRRDDGWPGSPRFRYILRDTAGNAGVLA